MKDQDAHRRHDWMVIETTRSHPSIAGYIEEERCTRCHAKRVIQYPPGMILDSDPKPLPKFCEIEN